MKKTILMTAFFCAATASAEAQPYYPSPAREIEANVANTLYKVGEAVKDGAKTAAPYAIGTAAVVLLAAGARALRPKV